MFLSEPTASPPNGAVLTVVLILVLLDVPFGDPEAEILNRGGYVLILVLLDVPFGVGQI